MKVEINIIHCLYCDKPIDYDIVDAEVYPFCTSECVDIFLEMFEEEELNGAQ